MRDTVDTVAVTAAWEQALGAPAYQGLPVWIHGDLLPGNLLLDEHGRFTAVIDFGGLAVGDPACDLLTAWSLFSRRSRVQFRCQLAVDDATWERGRGWALSVGLIALPYYHKSNPVFARTAARMPTPDEVHQRYPITDTVAANVLAGRQALQRILDHQDPRLIVVVGPCSIHDPLAGLDYARRLSKLARELDDTFLLVMRVYFEKPRTTTGWKGFINDPFMDDSFQIDKGICLAREFLLEVNQLGLPTATEALDPFAPQYIGDLIAWTAIGARTSESQTHREMSSGLSTPVGFKNGTDGSVATAVNAILSASQAHSFLGVNGQGRSSIIRTRGNRYGHLVLRGGGGRPNYDSVSVALADEALKKAGLPSNIIVDCSHDLKGCFMHKVTKCYGML